MKHWIAALMTLALIVGCGGKSEEPKSGDGKGKSSESKSSESKSKYPGTEEGAKQMLSEFLKEGADLKALTMQLKPTRADYEALFDAAVVDKVAKAYEAAWEKALIKAKPGQTEILLHGATTEDLRAKNDKARQLPGGFSMVADKLKPGVTWYRFKFVKPGERLGMSFPGLVYVNGQWRFVPKPWRALR